jgi:BTB/POZ domain
MSLGLEHTDSPHPNPPLSPLSYDDGDVILRAGNTDFKVHIFLLRLSSPFFKSMFSLPQPKLGNSEIPVIPMDEDATHLDFVLRTIYPGKRPQATSIEQAQQIFEIADKLEVECVFEAVRISLTQLLAAEPDPLRSWAIAVRYGLEEARRDAAGRFHPDRFGTLPEDLAYVNALQYARLLEEKGYRLY